MGHHWKRGKNCRKITKKAARNKGEPQCRHVNGCRWPFQRPNGLCLFQKYPEGITMYVVCTHMPDANANATMCFPDVDALSKTPFLLHLFILPWKKCIGLCVYKVYASISPTGCPSHVGIPGISVPHRSVVGWLQPWHRNSRTIVCLDWKKTMRSRNLYFGTFKSTTSTWFTDVSRLTDVYSLRVKKLEVCYCDLWFQPGGTCLNHLNPFPPIWNTHQKHGSVGNLHILPLGSQHLDRPPSQATAFAHGWHGKPLKLITGWWFQPIWKMWVRQLGWWHSEYMEK